MQDELNAEKEKEKERAEEEKKDASKTEVDEDEDDGTDEGSDRRWTGLKGNRSLVIFKTSENQECKAARDPDGPHENTHAQQNEHL